jgi:phosphoribosylamine--glycine ligase / phosphoribosylformylglycinamidine cyclo-ligase
MSVNDLIVQGAEPLYFLDYFACSKLDVQQAADVIKGIAEGCRRAGCALIGGETAEMPGMYQLGRSHACLSQVSPMKNFESGDYDLAGFAVGAVERALVLPRLDIISGDILLGIPSSGLHSNGFSLIRKVISLSGLTYSSRCPWNSQITLGEYLLEPTKIYIKSLLPAAQKGLLKGMANITGGGFLENIPRVLPKGTGCYIDATTWELPAVFKFLMNVGGIQPIEMARTFNNGIGMVVVVSPECVEDAIQNIQNGGEPVVYKIGQIVNGVGVEMRNLDAWKS